MKYWRIPVLASGTAIVYVEAETAEEAAEKARHAYDGMSLSLCFQCSAKISDPMLNMDDIGIESVVEADEDDGAAAWIKENAS